MSQRLRTSAPAIPILARDEFARAKAFLGDFDNYSTYDDWLDHQEGIQIGYSMAGVDAKLVRIRLAAFLKWCAQQQVSPGEQTLFQFAEAVGEHNVPAAKMTSASREVSVKFPARL